MKIIKTTLNIRKRPKKTWACETIARNNSKTDYGRNYSFGSYVCLHVGLHQVSSDGGADDSKTGCNGAAGVAVVRLTAWRVGKHGNFKLARQLIRTLVCSTLALCFNDAASVVTVATILFDDSGLAGGVTSSRIAFKGRDGANHDKKKEALQILDLCECIIYWHWHSIDFLHIRPRIFAIQFKRMLKMIKIYITYKRSQIPLPMSTMIFSFCEAEAFYRLSPPGCLGKSPSYNEMLVVRWSQCEQWVNRN